MPVATPEDRVGAGAVWCDSIGSWPAAAIARTVASADVVDILAVLRCPSGGPLGVCSRDEVVRFDLEDGWIAFSDIADGLEGCPPA
jgi:hypothetical protein